MTSEQNQTLLWPIGPLDASYLTSIQVKTICSAAHNLFDNVNSRIDRSDSHLTSMSKQLTMSEPCSCQCQKLTAAKHAEQGVEEVGGGCLVERFQTGSVRCCCFPSNQLWYLLVHYKWVHPKRALFKDSCHHCGMLACIVNILNPHNGGGDSGAFTWLDLGSHLSAACPSYHSSVDTRVLLLLLPSPAALIW